MSRDRCAEHRNLVLLCQALRLIVSLEKSELFPQQLFAFVSIHCNLISFIALKLENWIKVIQAA